MRVWGLGLGFWVLGFRVYEGRLSMLFTETLSPSGLIPQVLGVEELRELRG